MRAKLSRASEKFLTSAHKVAQLFPGCWLWSKRFSPQRLTSLVRPLLLPTLRLFSKRPCSRSRSYGRWFRLSRLVADPAGSYGVDVCMRSLRDVGQACWKDVLEPLILFDRILREDPANA